MWWVEFDPQVAREQAGRRPGIVVEVQPPNLSSSHRHAR
ncbi:type II toxin-antitoxin system PemK/MazF family toxin [Catelliglobosispora koreensis]